MSKTDTTAVASAELPATDRRQLRRVLASSFLGSMIEYYDFLLYASAAAIVFGDVFFTGLSSGTAAFASFGTLAAGYAARPVGGIIFGHFGDRIGRKQVLVVSMMLMGVSTVLIGLLPSTASIGALAPILLVCLRLVQGLAVGGEWGGAMTIAMEHAPGGKRGFAASFANMGAPAGALAGTLAMTAAALLPDEQFLSWGWRIPFLASAVLIAVGLFVRLKVTESPMFQRFEAEAHTRRIPVVEVFHRYLPRVGLGMLVGVGMFSIAGMATVWALNFAVAHGTDKSDALGAKAIAALFMLLATIISARVCDHFGRRPVLLVGLVGALLFVVPCLELVKAGSGTSFLVAVAVAQTFQGIVLGPLAVYIAELFPTRIRFTASSLCFQGASIVGAGLAPPAAAALVLLGNGSTVYVAAAWMTMLTACTAAVFLSREGKGITLS